MAFIACNQIEYNKLFQKIKTQEELNQAEQKLQQANSLTRFNSLFTDLKKSVYLISDKSDALRDLISNRIFIY